MNVIQSLLQGLQHQNTPPHIGEVFNMWAYFIALKESRAICLLMLNHTVDSELKEAIEHFVADVEEPQIQQMRKLLRDEGIDFPNVTSDKAKAEPMDVPAGAKLTDVEIANLLVVKLNGLLVGAHTGLVQAVRDDLGQMWLGFHNQLLAQALTLKALMRKRGWLRMPPMYHRGSGTVPS